MSQSTTQVPCGEIRRGTLSSLGATVKRLYAAYVAWRLEKTAIAALRSMSDSDLGDIGLTRGEIMSAVKGRAGRLRQYVPEY